MLNILYINHYAGSPDYGMEFRPYYLSKEWIDKGHQVKILAADFSHVRTLQPVTDGRKRIEQIDGIEYTWYPTPVYNANGVQRARNIFSFLWQVAKDANNIANGFFPDVVIASSTYPLDIWVAKYIAKKANAKLIFEVHDLWPLSPIELGGMSPNNPFILLCQIAENYAYKHADHVVSMLPNVHEHMASHGLDLNKLHIIPNGVVEKDWEESSLEDLEDGELRTFLLNQKKQGKMIVGYAGSHGKPNALEYLLQSSSLIEDKDIIFVLVGDGLEKEKLITLKNKMHLDNVFFFESVKKSQVPMLLYHFDIAYIGLLFEPLFRFGISPNKLMDYMMAAKPIVCAIKAGNDPVSEICAGITVEPENPEGIAKGIMKLVGISCEEREKMGKRGRKFIKENRTYKILADKFLSIM